MAAGALISEIFNRPRTTSFTSESDRKARKAPTVKRVMYTVSLAAKDRARMAAAAYRETG